MTAIEINSKVSFRLSDSADRGTGVVINVIDNTDSFLDSMGVEYSRYRYDVRDDRTGWVHRMGTTGSDGNVRKIGVSES